MWEPPTPPGDADAAGLSDRVAQRLTELGARPWQVELTRDLLTDAILMPSDPAELELDPEPDPIVDPGPDA
jgi:hypothetical protein